MVMNELIRTTVGADLSHPPPIYRPLVGVPLSGLMCKILYRPTLVVPLIRCNAIANNKGLTSIVPNRYNIH